MRHGARHRPAVDYDADGDVDHADWMVFASCISGPMVIRPTTATCSSADLDGDQDVDLSDGGLFQRCFSGTGKPADPSCGN